MRREGLSSSAAEESQLQNSMLLFSRHDAVAVARGAKCACVRLVREQPAHPDGAEAAASSAPPWCFLESAEAGATVLAAVDSADGAGGEDVSSFADLTLESVDRVTLGAVPGGVSDGDVEKLLSLAPGDAIVFVIHFAVLRLTRAEGLSSDEFWGAMTADEIPTKAALHVSFTDAIDSCLQRKGQDAQTRKGQDLQTWTCLLDLGCGDGRIARDILSRARSQSAGLHLIGVDVCQDGIRHAETLLQESGVPSAPAAGGGGVSAAFYTGDVTDVSNLPIPGEVQVCLCQLLISVIGDVGSRAALLREARRVLAPNGVLLLSASGASEDVNENYKALYEQDKKVTGEYRTYISRGAQGQALYVTHHFEVPELEGLLTQAGFVDVQTRVESEASSRRPEEKAIFIYASARVP